MSKKVQYLKGVGPVRARQLARLGIFTARDLIEHYPREYSRRRRVDIGQLRAFGGETVIISGKILAGLREYRRRVHILNVNIADATGQVRCAWFNQSYLKAKLQPGQQISVAGKFSPDYGGSFTVQEYSLQGPLPRILPVYSLTEGITSQVLTRIIEQALRERAAEELFPPEFRTEQKLMSQEETLWALHFPRDPEQLAQALYSGKFSELFIYQASFLYWRRQKKQRRGAALNEQPQLITSLEQGFGFTLSQDQRSAIDEIMADLSGGQPMNRLLLGDVGSGKTAVAAYALFTAALNGYQAVLMAPTEIVATQHQNTLAGIGAQLGVKVRLLTGSTKKAQRQEINRDLAAGGTVLVGTHAVFQAEVEIPALALVITDEQHRFGVGQRLALSEKGDNPHVLAMSATPIPRTLAMTLYGDLDISLIARKPPGRKEVKTLLVPVTKRQWVFDFLRQELAKGHSGYIICPLIEESEEINALSLAAYEKVLAQGLPASKYGVLHGRLTGAEKDKIIADLQGGSLDFLLATTVVEVGVDIGNATFIVIENSERYGLAQLHQLRGRVGRRDVQSYCFLMVDGPGAERLKILAQTSDGFKVAQADLQARGSGQFLGQQQHGLNEFRLTNLAEDGEIARAAREAAVAVLADIDHRPEWTTAAAQIHTKIANLKS